MEQPEVPWALSDLRARLELGMARGGGLAAAVERGLMDAVEGLSAPAGLLLARLLARRRALWRLPDLVVAGVADVPAAWAELRAAGVVDERVAPREAASVAPRAALVAAARRLGLPVSGRREALAQAVCSAIGEAPWDDAPWGRVAVEPTVLRVERWATLEPWPRRDREVLGRLGVVRWRSYGLTTGGLVADRQAWDRVEALLDVEARLTPDGVLDALGWPDEAWPPGRLDRRRALRRRLREAAEEAARLGAPAQGAAWLARLLALSAEAPRVGDAVRLARLLERAGAQDAAWSALLAARDAAPVWAREPLARPGRRLARSLRRTWVPDPPGPPVPQRVLRLPGAEAGARPRYDVGGAVPVEEAVRRALGAVGREAHHAEGALWWTIARLLLDPLLWLPIPGQLPVPRLHAPLDLGRPGFLARRAAAWSSLQAALCRGEAGERLQAVFDALGGDAPDLEPDVDLGDGEAVGDDEDPRGRARPDAAALRAIVAATPAPALCLLIEAAATGGRRALSGLPDLVVLPGAPARLPHALPATVEPGLALWEVKGPGDALRDGQRGWLHRLLDVGVAVEVVGVEPAKRDVRCGGTVGS